MVFFKRFAAAFVATSFLIFYMFFLTAGNGSRQAISVPSVLDSLPQKSGHSFVPTCKNASLMEVACMYHDYETLPAPEQMSNEVQRMVAVAGRASTSMPKKLDIFKHGLALQPYCPKLLELLGNQYHVSGDLETAWSYYLQSALYGNAASGQASQTLQREVDEIMNRLKTFADKLRGLWEFAIPGGLDISGEDYASFRKSYVKNTNGIEGNMLSYEQVSEVLEEPYYWNNMHTEATTIEQRETCGAAEAFDYVWWRSSPRGRPLLSVSFLKEIHKRLMGGISPEEAGKFRDHVVFVNGKKAPQPEHLDSLLNLLEERWASVEFRSLHPIIRAVIVQLEFVWAHPFFDGNGRVGRFLSTAVLRSTGYQICDLEAMFRDEYYNAVAAALPAGGGNILPLLRLYCKCLPQSLGRTIGHMELNHYSRLSGVKQVVNNLILEYLWL